MENKATVRFKPISLEKIKKGNKLHFVMVSGRNGTFTIAGGNENCYNIFWKSIWQHLKVNNHIL